MGTGTARVLAAVLLAAASATAAAGERPVPRHVLALVEGTAPDPENEDLVHELLELPLNHLGVVVRRHYLGNGPPPAAALEDARAVLTFFQSEDVEAPWLWPWLESEVPARGLRVVHFGEFGPLVRDGPERLARWLARFGLEYDDGYLAGPVGVDVRLADERTCAMEASPLPRACHRGPRNLSATNHVWVETRDHRSPADARAPVVTGPWGAVALDPWTLQQGSDDLDRRWHLDPFAFFREALGLERVPAPHPSVLNGRRMWLMHVDGDGFESLSAIRAGQLAARVMLDEVFLRYRLPFSVSVIVRSLTDDYAVAEPTDAMKLARRILNLPNVEPASHGVLHTLRWQEDWAPPLKGRLPMSYPSLKNYAYGQVAEVRESLRFIDERLLGPGRRTAVMFWTGAANPREDAILAAGEAGALNLNGGVFRWDDWHDSVGFVKPWSRRAGRGLQVYAGAANENDFAGFFDTMPGAFAHVDQTIERTGGARILKPADLYLHFYSAESAARLKSVHDLIERWALREPTAPVFASTYCRAVVSAVETARVAATERGWALRDFGDCRTARIDNEPRDVDFGASRGLLGARRRGGALYLHLAGPDADVALAEHPAPHPHVEQANCLLDRATLTPVGVEVTATAWNARTVVLAGFPTEGPVTILLDGFESSGRADAEGRVAIDLPDPGRTRILVRNR